MSVPVVKLSNKEIVEKYFASKPSPDGPESLCVCLLCYPDWDPESNAYEGRVKTLTRGKGHTWAIQHLKGKHKGYDDSKVSNHTLLISDAASNPYDWIYWTVSENRDISFCEKELMRHDTRGNLKPISTPTLKKRMHFIVQAIEQVLSKSLPAIFGVSFDGWSEFGVHYLAVFAVGPGLPKDNPALLGFSPFEQEDDLSADQYRVYLNSLLGYYGRVEQDISYLAELFDQFKILS